MAGRILNRQARTKILYNLLAVVKGCHTRDSLGAALVVGQTALDAGPDVEKIREACNLRLKDLIEAQKVREKANVLFNPKS